MTSIVLLFSFLAVVTIGALLVYNGFAKKWSQKYLWAVMGLCIIALAASAYAQPNNGETDKAGSKAAEKQLVDNKETSGTNSAPSEEASDAATAEKIEDGAAATTDNSKTNATDAAKQTSPVTPSTKTPASQSQSATNQAPYNQTPDDVATTSDPPAPPSNPTTTDQTSNQTDTGSSSTPTDQTNTGQTSTPPPAPPPPPAIPQ